MDERRERLLQRDNKDFSANWLSLQSFRKSASFRCFLEAMLLSKQFMMECLKPDSDRTKIAEKIVNEKISLVQKHFEAWQDPDRKPNVPENTWNISEMNKEKLNPHDIELFVADRLLKLNLDGIAHLGQIFWEFATPKAIQEFVYLSPTKCLESLKRIESIVALVAYRRA